MVYLFLTEKLPVDLTAFLGLVVLIFGGYLSPAEAFAGFSSPAVITMLGVFVVGASLLETGVADLIGGRVHTLVGSSETRLIAVLMLVAGALSAFMNNIAATAVLMPAVAAIATRAGLDPSRLFMPLAFGAILGGTTTLVGTPPNIVAAQLLQERGLEPFSLFDFTPLGLALLGVGTLFMLTLGRRLLPAGGRRGRTETASGQLREHYQLDDRLFWIRLPDDSPLAGRSLAATRMGNTLGVKVLAILRDGERTMAPPGDEVLAAGDMLFVDGTRADVEPLLKLQELEVEDVDADPMPADDGITGARIGIPPDSAADGRSLRTLSFRQAHGLIVLAIRRGDRNFRTHLADLRLSPGDELIAVGGREDVDRIASVADYDVLDRGPEVIEALGDRLCAIVVPPDSQLVGATIAGSRLGELVGLTVAGLRRGSETRLAVKPDEVLQARDRLLVTAPPDALEKLIVLGDVTLPREGKGSPLESEEVGLAEVAVAPRSSLVGRTLGDLAFRERFGLLALALWREGRPIQMDLTDEALRFGDALLLHGPRDRIQRLVESPDLLVLSGAERAPRRTGKAKWAVLGLLAMIGLVVSGFQPIHVAAFAAASFVLLARTLTMPEAYRAIEWKAIFLVAAVLPVGLALERTGAAGLLADTVVTVAGPLGPYPTLAAVVIMASLLSQGLDGAPAVVLMAPVVIQAAEGLGMSPYPMMMGVSLAASAAFMTPFSHKANLLVMGAGGYRTVDYVRVGSPLTIAVVAIIVAMVPIFFPF